MADKRFSALSADPRYRFPSRKKSRTAVDPRFKGVFTDPDFQKKATVDRYGRKINAGSGKKELERLYRLDEEDESIKRAKKNVREESRKSDEESEDDESEEEQLAERKDPAREGGFSESSSDDDSTSDESEDENGLAEETAGQEQELAEVPSGEVTHRIAAVNMDWDNLQATDIMAVALGFAPATGGIESVAIYPSEFGRERMEQEKLTGPPKEIFASSKGQSRKNESEEDSEMDDDDEDEKIKQKLQRDQLDEGEEFDMPKLRQYQLDRLRYYYAVITCDSKTTAKALYDTLDTREYFSTANYFDLRFIPDDTSFLEDMPRETCTKLPAGYKPREFRTGALTHSKVRLTWDDEDPVRKEVQKRAFSRAEIDENDLQAYIASDISDTESLASLNVATNDRKDGKAAARRAKTRALLGLSDEPTKSKKNDKEVVGDVQITFTPGLGGNDGQGVFLNEPQDEESTRQRYIRREKERKQKRKEKMKAAKAGAAQSTGNDEIETGEKEAEVEDQGFDDPFFTDPAAAAVAEKKAKKADKQKKLAAQTAKDDENTAKRAELELLMADDQEDNLKHFDMREVEKAEKMAKRKGRKKGKQQDKTSAVEEDNFKIEAKDPRFRDLYESHEFAIDPSNPRFRGTKGMKELLEEGRRKRKLSEV